MNEVKVEAKFNEVTILPYSNNVEVVPMRIHTDYLFTTFYQSTPEHKEV